VFKVPFILENGNITVLLIKMSIQNQEFQVPTTMMSAGTFNEEIKVIYKREQWIFKQKKICKRSNDYTQQSTKIPLTPLMNNARV
jgi:hypothetical protein